MPEQSTGPATGAGHEAGGGSPPRMPRWVKWPVIILGILIALFLVLRLFGIDHGSGQHGPGGHMPGDGNPPASAPGHAPAGGHG